MIASDNLGARRAAVDSHLLPLAIQERTTRELVHLEKGWGRSSSGRAMKRVYLLRHAKSSWKHPELPDHERPLAGRGKRAAKAIVKHMRAQEFASELVLCSTARRARETLERIEPALGRAPVCVESGLYGASARELLARLRRLPDDVGSVLVIGHNPGIHELASELAGPAPELRGKFPTAALATLAFHGSAWGELGPEATELVELTRPRDL